MSRRWLLCCACILVIGTRECEPGDSSDVEFRSRKQLHSEVAELRKHEVAWREIKWKTCLIDGLRASREQKKPIILWIFIDRPIDDERC